MRSELILFLFFCLSYSQFTIVVNKCEEQTPTTPKKCQLSIQGKLSFRTINDKFKINLLNTQTNEDYGDLTIEIESIKQAHTLDFQYYTTPFKILGYQLYNKDLDIFNDEFQEDKKFCTTFTERNTRYCKTNNGLLDRGCRGRINLENEEQYKHLNHIGYSFCTLELLPSIIFQKVRLYSLDVKFGKDGNDIPNIYSVNTISKGNFIVNLKLCVNFNGQTKSGCDIIQLNNFTFNPFKKYLNIFSVVGSLIGGGYTQLDLSNNVVLFGVDNRFPNNGFGVGNLVNNFVESQRIGELQTTNLEDFKYSNFKDLLNLNYLQNNRYYPCTKDKCTMKVTENMFPKDGSDATLFQSSNSFFTGEYNTNYLPIDKLNTATPSSLSYSFKDLGKDLDITYVGSLFSFDLDFTTPNNVDFTFFQTPIVISGCSECSSIVRYGLGINQLSEITIYLRSFTVVGDATVFFPTDLGDNGFITNVINNIIKIENTNPLKCFGDLSVNKGIKIFFATNNPINTLIVQINTSISGFSCTTHPQNIFFSREDVKPTACGDTCLTPTTSTPLPSKSLTICFDFTNWFNKIFTGSDFCDIINYYVTPIFFFIILSIVVYIIIQIIVSLTPKK